MIFPEQIIYKVIKKEILVEKTIAENLRIFGMIMKNDFQMIIKSNIVIMEEPEAVSMLVSDF